LLGIIEGFSEGENDGTNEVGEIDVIVEGEKVDNTAKGCTVGAKVDGKLEGIMVIDLLDGATEGVFIGNFDFDGTVVGVFKDGTIVGVFDGVIILVGYRDVGLKEGIPVGCLEDGS
jgi:hypothetical protein